MPHHTTPHHTTPHHRFVFSVLEWITHESAFIFWLIALNITSSGIIFISYWGNWKAFVYGILVFLRGASLVFFSAILTDLVIYYLLKKSPVLLRSIKIILLALSAVMFLLDIFALWNYQTPFNIIMLEVVLMTNFREGSEFLADYVLDGRFIAFIVAVFIALAFLRKIYSFIQRHNVFLAIVIIAGGIIGLFGAIRDSFGGNLINSSAPARISYMAVKTYTSHKAYNDMLKASPKDITITLKMREIPNIVFILGESTTRNHMQIYGYELPTNPKLSARKGIRIFTDIVSPHSHTSAVVKKLFTFCRYDSPDEWFKYTSIFRIVKKAGYFTFWLSNQEAYTGGSALDLYLRQCDFTKFTDNITDRWQDFLSYDGSLFTILDEAMKNEHDKNFYLIHLMGCHGRYLKRYPLEYDKFSADDENGHRGISRSQKQTRAEYDNAVLYNDFIVDEIIRRFEDKNVIVIYVSDHGEEVYDSMNFAGHGIKIHSRSSIEIPFMIWTSPKFRKAYPELEARIASSTGRPYMTDDMIHTLLDIMGIETPEYDPSKSIINPKFDSSRKRIYAGMLYDKENGLHEIQ